jgi:nitric oxide reductase large subunit
VGKEPKGYGVLVTVLFAAVVVVVFGALSGTWMSVVVAHLWVEKFFEVFATVIMAFLLSHIGAVSKKGDLTPPNVQFVKAAGVSQ